MSTQPDDSYPDAWKPRHIKEREQQQRGEKEQQRTEFRLAVAALSDEEIAAIREGR